MEMAESTQQRVSASDAAQRWLCGAWTLLIISSALYFLSANEADNDLWFHLLAGKRDLASGGVPRIDDLSYTAAGLPWIDHEWLSHISFATLYNHGGDTALWLVKVGLALVTSLLLWRTMTRRTASVWIRGGVMVLTLAVLARGYAIRPQTITYLAIAWLFWWLDDREPGEPNAKPETWKDLALLGAVTVLWVNTHAGFLFGLVVLGVRAATPPWKYLAAKLRFLLVACVAVLLNPYGTSLFLYLRNELNNAHPLTEWQPVPLTDFTHAPFLVFLALLIMTLPFSRTFRRRPWWGIVVAGVAFMALQHRRHTPLLALTAAAPLADQLSGALAWLRHRVSFELSTGAVRIVALGLVLLAGMQMFLLFERLRRDGPNIVYQAVDYPVGAMRFLRREGIKGNVALPLEWGGYVLWHGSPDLAVSLDGRFLTVYSPELIETNFAFFRGDRDPAAARLLDDFPTNLVLVPRWTDTPAHHRPDWQVIYRDSVAELLARGKPQALVTAEAPSGWLRFP
jgi:hypothetical protein